MSITSYMSSNSDACICNDDTWWSDRKRERENGVVDVYRMYFVPCSVLWPQVPPTRKCQTEVIWRLLPFIFTQSPRFLLTHQFLSISRILNGANIFNLFSVIVTITVPKLITAVRLLYVLCASHHGAVSCGCSSFYYCRSLGQVWL